MQLRRTARPPVAAALVMTAALPLLAACSGGRAQPDASGPMDELARTQQRVELLSRQVELAEGKDFYLVLDPAGRSLALMLRGATLQRVPVLGVRVGFPRVSWFNRPSAVEWQGVAWSNGELDPPRPLDRVVLTPDPAKKGEETDTPPIPPTAEELYRIPTRYRIRFADGLSVEIRPLEADEAAGRFARVRAWWNAKWGDVAAAFGSSERDAVRLRVTLNPADAGSLYRALPPAVRLLVL